MTHLRGCLHHLQSKVSNPFYIKMTCVLNGYLNYTQMEFFSPYQTQDNVEDCENRGWVGVHGMRIVLGLNESVNKISFVLIS